MTTDLSVSTLDAKMLSMADYMSPEQISQKLGGTISPARVRLRLGELLEQSDWVTEAQREKLLVRRLHIVLSSIESRPGSEWDLDGLKVQLATLKELGNRLDKRAARTDVDLETWDRNVAMEMARVYDLALAFLKGALRSEIDPDRWDELAREALDHAQAELMKKAVEA